jgi:hypothetical protein
MAGGAGLGELVAAQGLAGGPGGIQRIGLSAVAASCSLGPVQLHHLLGVALQEPGQAGAVAAGAFNRPHTLTLMLASQLQQLPVAGRGGWHRHLLDHRTGRGDDHRSLSTFLRRRGGLITERSAAVAGVD